MTYCPASLIGISIFTGLFFTPSATSKIPPQLAARIGMVREVVTRALYRLQNQRLIIIDEKEIIVPSLAILAGYADSE